VSRVLTCNEDLAGEPHRHASKLFVIDPIACLPDLSASVSKNPAELTPVRPILEFDMVAGVPPSAGFGTEKQTERLWR
jgi:hypothetical protein